ncbi:MAG: EcsC family protein [Silicimonas sp.]|nr:EcsC family protein [Silicimonas sp.]NND17573.1 EcsC family protein [Silicimonas sp.]NNL34794.1 EcsC family protein [Silicimonas sp.]NNL74045.1 EcsC family protein [Silicimonas sp.]
MNDKRDLMPLPYVEGVLAEQDAYRNAGPSLLPRAVRSVARPVGFLTNRLIPAEVIEAAIRGADWAASSSIRKTAINHDFTDLEACDEAVADVRRWALGYAVTGGGAAGAFGALGLAIDVPATIALALRTVRLVGLSYGFGGDSEAERIYILDVLQLAGANSKVERDAAMARLAKERTEFGREDWQKIVKLTGQTTGSVTATRRVATTLGVNLSTRKIAQIAPFIGAAVGAGVNAAFQNDVAAAARFAYRARWLEVNEGIIDGHIVKAREDQA